MNVTSLLEQAAGKFGDRVIIGRRSDGLTASELRRSAGRGAAIVADASADALIYAAANGPAYPVALFAAAYAGVPLVPIDHRLGTTQLAALIAKHPGAVVIVDPSVELHGAQQGLTVMSAETWLVEARGGSGRAVYSGVENSPAVIVYTSGTTSAPKAVLLRHDNLTSHVLRTVQFDSAKVEEAALLSTPSYDVGAVTHLIANLFAGRRTIVRETLDHADWLEVVRSEAVTAAQIAPAMLGRILESPDDISLPSLRLLTYGGAPMPASVIRRAMETWPDINFVNAYDLTETSSTVARLLPEDHRTCVASDDPFVRARLGSVGRPVPGVEIEIRNAEGLVLTPGERGRVWVRGEQVSAEYSGLGRVVDDRDFFDTRDEGFLDEDGYLFLDGRSDDRIVRGASSVAPAEIESVLRRHPAVVDVAAIGVPGKTAEDQRIVAVVVLRDGTHTTIKELRRFAFCNLRADRVPDEIEFWRELPRTATGKLVRRDIVQRLSA